ncbi:MAG: hypothetical protein ACKO6N_10775 [Myxococcota bacterium]
MRTTSLLRLGLFWLMCLTQTAHAETAPTSWLIPAQLKCLFVTCALFYPADGSLPQPQSWNSAVELNRPGRLVVESSGTLLEHPLTAQQLELGPGTLLYLGGARFQPLSGMSLRYVHVPTSRAPLEILLPTFILGTEGTQFDLLTLSVQEVAVVQHEGRLLWKRLDTPLAPPQTLDAGYTLTLSTLQPTQHSLEPQLKRGLRSVRAVSSLPTPEELLRILEEERLSDRLLLDDETLDQLSAETLPSMTLTQRQAVATLLSTTRPEQPLAGRVLFQLWLQARLIPPEAAAAQSFREQLEQAFTSTPWPAQLAGMLIHEAMLSQPSPILQPR